VGKLQQIQMAKPGGRFDSKQVYLRETHRSSRPASREGPSAPPFATLDDLPARTQAGIEEAPLYMAASDAPPFATLSDLVQASVSEAPLSLFFLALSRSNY
jgi:hypothetical protein